MSDSIHNENYTMPSLPEINLDEISDGADLTPEDEKIVEKVKDAISKYHEKRIEIENKYRNVSIDFALIDLIMESPFFAELSRNIRKMKDFSIPTIGVGFDQEHDEFIMLYNPIFISTLNKTMLKNVLIHEFYHIVFEHISSRKKKPHRMWNIATDLAINSIIIANFSYYNSSSKETLENCFPQGGFIPGSKYRIFNKELKDEKLIKFIESLPELQSSEFYFEKLEKFVEENPEYSSSDGEGDSSEDNSEGNEGEGSSGGDGGNNKDKKGKGSKLGNSLDSHDKWDQEGSNSNKQLVKQKLQKILEKAAREGQKNGWGNVSQEVRRKVEEIVNRDTKVNWKDVLRNFVSNISATSKRNSIKRINRKYPYTHPGTIRNRVPRILIALDESGSITDKDLGMFFDELTNLTKLVSIDVIPFDTIVNKEQLISWKKGQKIEHIRKLSGGTDFDAPTRFANSDENRGRWDALIIFTDGYAPKPTESRIKRGWVMIPGYDIKFQTDDIVVKLER